MDQFFTGQPLFESYTMQHYGIVLAIFSIGLLVILFGKFVLSEQNQYRLGGALSLFILGVSLIWLFFENYHGRFTIATHLPIAICNFVAFTMPLVMIGRRRWLFEIYYFWILVGTFQANFTPDLSFGFPHFSYFKYWIVHTGLVVVLFYAIFVYGYRPYPKSILKSIGALAVFFVFTIIINYLTDANHMYLNAKPPVASLLDYLGPWPWYMFTGTLVIIPLFILAYLPYYFLDWFKGRKNKI